MDIFKKFFTSVFALFILAFIMAPIVSLILAFIFMLLWNWLAPLFWAAAPVLGYWESVGVMLFIYLFKITLSVNKNNA